jgi:steroid delta-isomerase-like uncharacterized protein
MSTEQNMRIARRIGEELFNQGNVRSADELIAPDAVDHNEPPGTDCREHFKRGATMLRNAFPDLLMRIEHSVAEEDRVALLITVSGTHTGPGAAFGIPPTGKPFRIQQMRFARFANGQMTESWAVIDMLAWMRQLGAAPNPGTNTNEAAFQGH